ncbi:hypothetical protein [Xanthomonas albilineans]|uniref:hypothetical protein n=1 Tax=Xanthomonas albilineans TaxID=29447 RepID=UPI0027D9C18D|nr:hypothetical protein [Xanthomonas albilineans]
MIALHDDGAQFLPLRAVATLMCIAMVFVPPHLVTLMVGAVARTIRNQLAATRVAAGRGALQGIGACSRRKQKNKQKMCKNYLAF